MALDDSRTTPGAPPQGKPVAVSSFGHWFMLSREQLIAPRPVRDAGPHRTHLAACRAPRGVIQGLSLKDVKNVTTFSVQRDPLRNITCN